MFCSQCGAENQASAHFCQSCGSQLAFEPSKKLTDSVAPPVQSAKPRSAGIGAIWNPNAAANWSLLLSPAFGSYLQMINWRTLGEVEKEASSQNWFYASLGMLAFYILVGLFISDEKVADASARGLGILFLFLWYFVSGRSQAKYVKEHLGPDYAKKPWGKALLIAFGAMIAYFLFAVAVGFVLFA